VNCEAISLPDIVILYTPTSNSSVVFVVHLRTSRTLITLSQFTYATRTFINFNRRIPPLLMQLRLHCGSMHRHGRHCRRCNISGVAATAANALVGAYGAATNGSSLLRFNMQPIIMLSQTFNMRERCTAARFNTYERLFTGVGSKVLIRTGHFIISTHTLALDTQHGTPKADHTTHAKIMQ
jgi:hypothetical protein